MTVDRPPNEVDRWVMATFSSAEEFVRDPCAMGRKIVVNRGHQWSIKMAI